MDYIIKELETFMVVTTPYRIIPNITPYKKYIILGVDKEHILIRNDNDEVHKYRGIEFIEADVFFALSLYMTYIRILGLTNNPLKSLNK